MTEAPHVPEDTMKRWKEAVRRGDNAELERLVDDLVKPVLGSDDVAITGQHRIPGRKRGR
jgi:hypothetical protein